MAKTDCVKVTFNLASDFYIVLKSLAEKRGITMTEVLNQAIGTEKFLHECVQKGCKVLIEHPDGSYEQLHFRGTK